MNESNRELLGQVVENRLTAVLDYDLGTDEGRLAFKEAMDAIDREINLRKLDDSYFDESEKRRLEEKKIDNSQNEKTALTSFEEKKFNFEEEKFNFSKEEQLARREMDQEKQTNENDHRKKESLRSFWLKVGEITAVVVLAPGIQYISKKALAKLICTFEKDYTFTTTVGKSFGSFFRFKD